MEIPMMVALVLGWFSLLLLKHFLLPSKRLPPGPRPLPIFGNFLLLKKSSSLQDLAMELGRKYGPIYTLWLGSTPVIVISGPEIIYEAMIKQGDKFVNRRHLISNAYLQHDNPGFATSNGERLRFFRKLVVSEVLSQNRVAGFRPIRDEEGDIFMESLRKEALQNGGVVTGFRELIRLTASNLLIGICFGRRLTLEEYLDMDEVMTQRFKMAFGKPRDFIPLLQLFPDKEGVQRQLDMRKRISNFFKPLIDERRRILSSGAEPEKGAFADTLLALRGKSAIDITDDDIEFLCQQLLNAGSDTTSLTVEYALANIINHPEIQEKLFEEIQAVAGAEVVREEDIPKLPYLQAVVKETLRRHTPARLSPSRVSFSATKLAGYDIPAHAMVLQHLEAVAMNPKIWENPLEFWPARFLNKSLDITGSTEITMIPFGVGRRMCPAINIALLHSHLLIARLVQAFEWKPTTPGQLLDLTPDTGITSTLKYPLTALVRERLQLD